MFPATPNRPDRVNHKASGQTISASNFCFARLTTAECSTFGEQFRSGSAVNRAVHPAAAEKCCICGVHAAIDIELRDVAADNVDLSGGAQSVSDCSSGHSRRQSSAYV